MATNDESIASKVEAWMVATIEAADSESGKLGDVDHFEGTAQELATGQANELLRNRCPVVRVAWARFTTINIGEGDQQVGSEYVVYVGVKNDRAAATPRIGDASSKGVNWCRELVQTALHDKHPGVTSSNFAVETCELVRTETVWQTQTDWILAMFFAVPEVPEAA